MAKSTRSKVKRHFRAKKREEGVYAATEAARLHRLSMKLKTLAAQENEDEDMPEGEARPENAEADRMDDDGAGWWSPSPHSTVDSPLWFAALGLVDADDISPECMSRLCEPPLSMVVQDGASQSGDLPARVRITDKDRSDCPKALDRLFRSTSCPDEADT